MHRLMENPVEEGRYGPWAMILAPTRELALQIHKDAQLLGKHTGLYTLPVYGGTGYESQRLELEKGYAGKKSDAMIQELAKMVEEGIGLKGTYELALRKFNARLKKVVIDRGVNIPPGLVVGEDPDLDARRFRRTAAGVCLITQPMIDQLQT